MSVSVSAGVPSSPSVSPDSVTSPLVSLVEASSGCSSVESGVVAVSSTLSSYKTLPLESVSVASVSSVDVAESASSGST